MTRQDGRRVRQVWANICVKFARVEGTFICQFGQFGDFSLHIQYYANSSRRGQEEAALPSKGGQEGSYLPSRRILEEEGLSSRRGQVGAF